MRARVPHRWRRTMIRLAAVCLPALLLAGCLFPPEPMTTEAEEVRTLFLVIFGLGAIVFVGVEGFLLYAIVRYRRKDDRLPEQHHGNTKVEIVWTVIPTVIVLILFVTSMFTLGNITVRSDDPIRIEVEGQQFSWTFRYDNGYAVTGSFLDPPVLVVPTGQAVRLSLVSRDVIHSFFVPAFLVKTDVVPFGQGQAPNELEFTVTTAGTYRGQCAEFCGTLHADMTFAVQAMEPAKFEEWLSTAASATPTPAASVPPNLQVVELTADNIEFSVDQLQIPAGERFIIRFTNAEGVDHNVSIYDGDTTLFTGAKVTGPDVTVDYLVPALEPGGYTFICDFHPIQAMTGTLTVN
ncbi:MAG: cytochrome c oxidase subunit II [Candidatus Limnocylindria bacterium]